MTAISVSVIMHPITFFQRLLANLATLAIDNFRSSYQPPEPRTPDTNPCSKIRREAIHLQANPIGVIAWLVLTPQQEILLRVQATIFHRR